MTPMMLNFVSDQNIAKVASCSRMFIEPRLKLVGDFAMD
jgi:hypothetical protein